MLLADVRFARRRWHLRPLSWSHLQRHSAVLWWPRLPQRLLTIAAEAIEATTARPSVAAGATTTGGAGATADERIARLRAASLERGAGCALRIAAGPTLTANPSPLTGANPTAAIFRARAAGAVWLTAVVLGLSFLVSAPFLPFSVNSLAG